MEVPTLEQFKALMLRVKELEAAVETFCKAESEFMSKQDVQEYFSLKSDTPIKNWVKEGLLNKYYPGGDESKPPRFKRTEVVRVYELKRKPFFT